jgi:hypothetical protein
VSKRLVIDASVLRASGESVHPVSRACREFLEHVRDICHRAVVTEAILNEWRRHQSKFASRWRLSMYASRKIVKIQIAPDRSMRRRLQRQGLTLAEKDAMLKDVHLIEAALAADKIVASLDDEARRLFNVAELNTVVWVNPVAHHEDCLTWLADGAEPAERWLLGGP